MESEDLEGGQDVPSARSLPPTRGGTLLVEATMRRRCGGARRDGDDGQLSPLVIFLREVTPTPHARHGWSTTDDDRAPRRVTPTSPSPIAPIRGYGVTLPPLVIDRSRRPTIPRTLPSITPTRRHATPSQGHPRESFVSRDPLARFAKNVTGGWGYRIG